MISLVSYIFTNHFLVCNQFIKQTTRFTSMQLNTIWIFIVWIVFLQKKNMIGYSLLIFVLVNYFSSLYRICCVVMELSCSFIIAGYHIYTIKTIIEVRCVSLTISLLNCNAFKQGVMDTGLAFYHIMLHNNRCFTVLCINLFRESSLTRHVHCVLYVINLHSLRCFCYV